MIYFKYMFRLICFCGFISILILLIKLTDVPKDMQQYPSIDNDNVTEILLPLGEEFVAYIGLNQVITKPTLMKCSGEYIIRNYNKDGIKTCVKIKGQSK